MEQITAMKITALSFCTFRSHTEPEGYAFGDVTYITGDNGAGKTTMAHGVAYALYGVSFFGEQAIERLMSQGAEGTQVRLDFTDQAGNPHTLIRTRKRDKTSLLLDSYTVRQTDIDRIFCDKDTFLSMFNPSYLIELGEKGRGLVLKHLKPVPPGEVLKQMPEALRGYLDKLDMTQCSVEEMTKNYREMIRHSERQLTILDGHLQSVQEAMRTASQRLDDLYREKLDAKQKANALSDKQFAGIDLDDLALQKDVLMQKLTEGSRDTDAAILELRAKIEHTRQKTYQSKYAQAKTELQAQIKALSGQYKALGDRIKALRAGTQCPTCLMRVTAQNLPDVRNGMMAELQSIAAKGQELVEQKKGLDELDGKSEAAFEQFRSEDLKKLTEQLDEAEKQRAAVPNANDIRQQIELIEEQQRHGTLSEAEWSDLQALQAEVTGIEAQIQAVEEMADEKQLKELTDRQKEENEQLLQYRNILTALAEYAAKRTELAVKDLQMPNVHIQLYDVVRTTGEVVDVFRFTYKQRDYRTLSLSEKILAGIEVAAMMRRITGIDCPICIDNTESIGAFNAVPMPSQTLLLRFTKGRPLTVQAKNNAVPHPVVQELKKAG